MKKNFGRLLSAAMVLFLALIACVSSPAPSGTEVPAEPLVAADVATATAVPAVQHQSVPGELPAERSSHAGDHDSSQTAEQKQAPGGDRFTFGRYERPFNADTMDVYFPYLDIQDTLIYQDDIWLYAVITLKGGDEAQHLAGKYAVEIDTNADGGGDWLIVADKPSSTEWSTSGVQVWSDTNDDVGGEITINADKQSNGNGYETLVFDQDGADHDLAWARISPQDPNSVQIAAKNSLLEGDTSFMAGVWAGNADLDPALFDLNDHYTHEQAGAALIDLEYFYPIKAISELDNTCRMAIGFQPTGNEPGLCAIPIKPEEPESCTGQVVCYNFGNQTVCYCLEP